MNMRVIGDELERCVHVTVMVHVIDEASNYNGNTLFGIPPSNEN